MTIATVGGAGDAGKTTILDLLAKEFSARNQYVLSIDANPDQNLLSFAGIDAETIGALPKLCDEFNQVKMILEGNNPFFASMDKIVSTSPVTQGTTRWRFDRDDDAILSHFATRRNGATYMQTGTYTAGDIGTGCLHSKIENLVFTLERLDDGDYGERGIVLVDQAHGRDAFGTPLYAQGDTLLIVTKANKKSLDILSEYLEMAQEIGTHIGHPVNIGVVGNALRDTAQEDKIKQIAGDHYIAGLRYDAALEREDSNEGPELIELMSENRQAVTAIADHVAASERNWHRRKAWLELCHFKASWYDYAFGTDVRQQKTDYVLTPHAHGPNCGCNHHG